MIWFILFPIWFAYQAKKDNKSPWGYALLGFVLAFCTLIVAGVINQILFKFAHDPSVFTTVVLRSIAMFLPLFGVVAYGFKLFHIAERKKRTSSNLTD